MRYTTEEQSKHAIKALKSKQKGTTLKEYAESIGVHYATLKLWIDARKESYRDTNIIEPDDIKYLLKKKGFSMSDIARELDVNPAAIFNVVHGNIVSGRIQKRIAGILGKKVSEVWGPYVREIKKELPQRTESGAKVPNKLKGEKRAEFITEELKACNSSLFEVSTDLNKPYLHMIDVIRGNEKDQEVRQKICDIINVNYSELW